MPTTPKGKFSDGEKLLCYHGPLLYEAKCVKHKKDGSGFSYYVHYQGWNKNWDEWVSESRMLKINPESLEMQNKLLEQHLAATKESKKKASKTTGKRSSSRASTPVRIESGLETTPLPPPSSLPKKKRSDGDEGRITKFKISIPEELRYVLVNDWDLVTSKKNLFIIPAKYPASALITDYLEHKTGSKNFGVFSEVTSGIANFFNRLIGLQFLYEIENKQFESIELSPDKTYMDIYGTAHLLRLLSRIDWLLNLTRIDVDPDVALIESVVGDLLKYMEDNMAKLFTSKNYKEATLDYLKNLPSSSN